MSLPKSVANEINPKHSLHNENWPSQSRRATKQIVYGTLFDLYHVLVFGQL